MAFRPFQKTIAPALPVGAADAVLATYVTGEDAWFEFDYAQLLLHVS
jgi:hypothetical protein